MSLFYVSKMCDFFDESWNVTKRIVKIETLAITETLTSNRIFFIENKNKVRLHCAQLCYELYVKSYTSDDVPANTPSYSLQRWAKPND